MMRNKITLPEYYDIILGMSSLTELYCHPPPLPTASFKVHEAGDGTEQLYPFKEFAEAAGLLSAQTQQTGRLGRL